MSASAVVAVTLAAVGSIASLSGAMGVVRMRDLYSRLQCSSKAVSLGALCVLVGVVIAEGPVSSYGSRGALVLALLVVVNPAASHALLRAAYRQGVDRPGREDRRGRGNDR